MSTLKAADHVAGVVRGFPPALCWLRGHDTHWVYRNRTTNEIVPQARAIDDEGKVLGGIQVATQCKRCGRFW